MTEYEEVKMLLSGSIKKLKAFNNMLKSLKFKEFEFFVNWCKGRCKNGWNGPSKTAVKAWQHPDETRSLCSFCKTLAGVL